MNLKRCYLPAILGALVLASEAAAQHPPTIWHALGIPQAYKQVTDARLNRKGKHPGLERKPPLKSLADPANLKSDVPAIKKAAEIKAQEDLAPQKVKAIKYLGQIGCGCYGGVAEALTAALEDCTEEVRYAAALAIVQSLSTNCQICKKTCCTKALAAKMYERAYEQDESGCFLEPSERVRAVLMEALNDCPPDMRDIGPGVVPSDTVPPDTVPPPDAPVVPPPDGAVPPRDAASFETDAGIGASATDRRQGQSTSLLHRSSARTSIEFRPEVPAQVSMMTQELTGEVVEGKTRSGLVRIQFHGRLRPAIGTEVDVYHAYVLRTEFAGRLVIEEYDGDQAIAAPRRWQSIKVARGDTVKCLALVPVENAMPQPSAPAALAESEEADIESRVASATQLLLPPPLAAPQRHAAQHAAESAAPPALVEQQLDARLLDILQPPPVVVEEVDEPATETRLEPVSSQVPAREAAVRLPVTTESTADEIEVVEEVEYLAPIVAPSQSLKKRK